MIVLATDTSTEVLTVAVCDEHEVLCEKTFLAPRKPRWELRDFGVFEVKTRASRIGRNPRTGDQVPVPERKVVTFRPGKKMKEVVASGVPSPPPGDSSEPTSDSSSSFGGGTM